MRGRRAAALLVALACTTTVHAAFGQASELPSGPTSGASGAGDLALAQKRAYWSGAGKYRPFLSSTLEGGVFFYRPQLAVGYGKPHWEWFGAESLTRFALGSATQYVGLRGALPNFELRAGGRYTWAANQSYLGPRAEYNRDDIELSDLPNSRYGALEAELSGAIPLLGGAITVLATGDYLFGVPDGLNVLEEHLRIVAGPPWLWRARGGYVHPAFVDGLILGGAVEVVGNPERDHHVVRLGPQLGAAVTHHLEATVSVMIVVASRDSLRLEGSDIGQFGLRYRWATGDPFPEFP
jgi:hypothetical protein